VTIVIGIDPGFASAGIAVVDLLPRGERVRLLDVCETQKAQKKRAVYASDDNVRRAGELAEFLEVALKLWKPVAICVESMSFPRNASSAQKVGIAWGVVAALAWKYDLPIVQQSPQAVKKAVCGDKAAPKEAVEAALRKMYPECATFDRYVPRSKREHPFDALAVVVACRGSELLLLARKGATDEPQRSPDVEQGTGRPAPRKVRRPRQLAEPEDDI